MSKPKQLYWIGDRDADGKPLEFFGGMPGVYDPIPARDLTPDETAGLTEAQWECIDSPAGKRLYRRTEPDDPSNLHGKTNQESGSSTVKSVTT
jgi:hypothetical protein